MHYGFTPGAADAIYMLRLFTKKNRFKNKKFRYVFFELEKTFDLTQKEVISYALRKVSLSIW